MNKPVFAQVSGGVKGAGAHLLSMLTMPLAYKNTFLKIDDVQRGMVPTMGGSHRLSRLPLKLGFYLALTGDELNFEEMTQLGYVKGFIRDGVGNREIRSRL
jgi:enoyl-CoA hydratase/carnithine racemase